MPLKYFDDVYDDEDCKCEKIHGICNCQKLSVYRQHFYNNQYPPIAVHKLAEKPLESSCCNKEVPKSCTNPPVVPIYMRTNERKTYQLSSPSRLNTMSRNALVKRTQNSENSSRIKVLPTPPCGLDQCPRTVKTQHFQPTRIKFTSTSRSEVRPYSSNAIQTLDTPMQTNSIQQRSAIKQHTQTDGSSFHVERGYKHYEDTTATKEVLAGQFPAPCLPICSNDDEIWERRFTKWWRKIRREEQMQERLINSERLSTELFTFPQTQTIAQPYKDDVKKSKYGLTFGKLIRAFLCDYKSSDTDREEDESKNNYECGKNDICEPQKKYEGYYKGTLEPCGEHCRCGNTKECMNQHFELTCPCKPCDCSNDQRVQSHLVLYNQQMEHPPVNAVGCCVQQCCSDSSDDSCVPAKNAPSTRAQGNLHVIPCKKVIEQGDCCCVCDESVCPCFCCLPEPRNNIMQTSRFNLKECCTQTDKLKGKCCRCCRCCREKYCNCMKKLSDENDYDQTSIGENHCMEPSAKGTLHKHSGTSQLFLSSSKGRSGKFHQISAYPVKFVNRATSQRPKTLMVRSDSSQCIPETQNKETCCSCDNQFSCSRMHQFIQHLNSQNYDTIKHSHNKGDCMSNNEPESKVPMAKFDLNDLKTITNAKLKTLFIEDGFYSSPLSGRNYNLTTNTVDIRTKFLDRNLPKLIATDDQLRDTKYPHQNLTKISDFEHRKLMTAVCETILSNGENSQTAASIDVNCSNNVDKTKFFQSSDAGSSAENDTGIKSNDGRIFLQDFLESKFSKRFNILEEKIDDLLKTRRSPPSVGVDDDKSLKEIPSTNVPNNEKMVSDALTPSPKKVSTKPTSTNTSSRNCIKNNKKIDKYSNFVPSVVPITRTGLVATIPNRYKNNSKDVLSKYRTTARSSSLDSSDRCKTQVEQIDGEIDNQGDVKYCGNQAHMNKERVASLFNQIENIHNTISYLNPVNENDSVSENVFDKKSPFDTIETIKKETSNLFSILTKNHLSALHEKNEDEQLSFDRAEEETTDNVMKYPKIELKHLDFSNIKFSKTVDNNDKLNCSIAGNLPSITSSISDTYNLRKIFSNGSCDLIENTSSPLLPELNPSIVKK